MAYWRLLMQITPKCLLLCIKCRGQNSSPCRDTKASFACRNKGSDPKGHLTCWASVAGPPPSLLPDRSSMMRSSGKSKLSGIWKPKPNKSPCETLPAPSLSSSMTRSPATNTMFYRLESISVGICCFRISYGEQIPVNIPLKISKLSNCIS